MFTFSELRGSFRFCKVKQSMLKCETGTRGRSLLNKRMGWKAFRLGDSHLIHSLYKNYTLKHALVDENHNKLILVLHNKNTC